MSQQEKKNSSILIVGCGSIGLRHLRNLQSLGENNIAVCDSNSNRLAQTTSSLNVSGYDNLTEALDFLSPIGVIICTPPNLHVHQALEAVRSDASVFIEKPLSHSMDGVDALFSEARNRNRIIQIGYNFRFHKGLRMIKEMLETNDIGRILWARAEVGQYLPEWQPKEDYRKSYTADRLQGGGIILDSSHEIDYMRWFFGDVSQVYCLADKISDLDVNVEDTAFITLRFASGCIGQINMDFVQRIRTRICKIVGAEGTILWDNWDSSIRVFTTKTSTWNHIDIQENTNDKYVAEMKYFLSCLRGSIKPRFDAPSARETLDVALAAHESAKIQRAVPIPFKSSDTEVISAPSQDIA